MVRANFKNYKDVTVITNIDQYKDLSDELNFNKGLTFKLQKRCLNLHLVQLHIMIQ